MQTQAVQGHCHLAHVRLSGLSSHHRLRQGCSIQTRERSSHAHTEQHATSRLCCSRALSLDPPPHQPHPASTRGDHTFLSEPAQRPSPLESFPEHLSIPCIFLGGQLLRSRQRSLAAGSSSPRAGQTGVEVRPFLTCLWPSQGLAQGRAQLLGDTSQHQHCTSNTAEKCFTAKATHRLASVPSQENRTSHWKSKTCTFK